MSISDKFTNLSGMSDGGSYQLNGKDLTAISVYISVIGGLGIIGNVMVMVAFYKYRTLRTSTNTFIVHLAACNLVLAVLDILFSLPSSIQHKWMLGLTACRFYGLTYYFFCSVSLNTLAIISLDRYWVITKPSIGIKITIRRAVLCILVSYAYTTVFMTPVFLEWRSFHEEAFYTGCYLNFTDSSIKSVVNALILGIFLFVVPFTVMIFCYGAIFTSVRRKGRYAVRMRPKCRTNKWRFTIQRIPHWRTARMIIVVIFIFLLCWSPYVIVSLCMAFGTDITVLTLEITLLVAKSGVIYNPFIYAALNLRFRTAFFEMLHCHRIASRTNWGVRTRVLSGATGDSSGYLTSRASGCPSSRGLGASLMRTAEKGSSVGLDAQKPSNTPEQEKLLLEHGILCKHGEQLTENRESSNSDELCSLQRDKTRYCNHCLIKCQKGLGKCTVCYGEDKKRRLRCSIENMKATSRERKYIRQPHKKERESQESNSRCGKVKSSKSRGSRSLDEKRSGSLMEINDKCVHDNRERQRHLRRGSLHLKHSSNSTEAHAGCTRKYEPMASCICDCHLNETTGVRKMASIVTPDGISAKYRNQNGENACASSNSTRQEKDTMNKTTTSSLGRLNNLVRGIEKSGPKLCTWGNPTFLRRTSEGVQVRTELAKNTESFWRRPSLVIMNNIRPITFEHQNI